VAACALSLVTTPGCDESRIVSESSSPVPVVKSPDRVETTSRRVSSYYAPGNPYVGRSIDELLARRDVGTVVGNFERSGFELARGQCFVLEDRGPEGEARVVVLTMPPFGPGVTETVLIACVEQNGKMLIAPAAFRNSPGERPGDFLRVGDSMWVSRTPLGPARTAADVAKVDDEFWIRVLDCVGVNAPAVAAACAVTCVLALEAYPICMVTCVTSQTVAVFVRCYLQAATTSPIKGRIPTKE
jgi:hypothetical protein